MNEEKQKLREKIERETRAFLKKGGIIKKIKGAPRRVLSRKARKAKTGNTVIEKAEQ